MVLRLIQHETTPKFLDFFLASTLCNLQRLPLASPTQTLCSAVPCENLHHCKILNSKVPMILDQSRNLEGVAVLRLYPKLDDAAPTISAPLFPSSANFGILTSFFFLEKIIFRVWTIQYSPKRRQCQMDPAVRHAQSQCMSGIDQMGSPAGVQNCL